MNHAKLKGVKLSVTSDSGNQSYPELSWYLPRYSHALTPNPEMISLRSIRVCKGMAAIKGPNRPKSAPLEVLGEIVRYGVTEVR